MKRRPSVLYGLVVLSIWLDVAERGAAWDYEGHRLVNQLALATLPTNFPAFVFLPAARERIAFLAGEPDRWRNTPDPGLKHFNNPDHYFDLEDLQPARMEANELTPFRFDFTVHLARARASRADGFPALDPAKDIDHTRSLSGFLPWTIAEHQGKLKSGFSYLHELERAGTPEEIANARENIIYVMGVMGHFVGDGAQPLHTTKHHHGWVGENPNHYSTNYSIHAWIDGGYLNQFGVTLEKLLPQLRPARALAWDLPGSGRTNVFPVVMAYLVDQHKQVEPLYRLEKAGKLSGRKEVNEEGYTFITGQLIQAGQMLGDLWMTAWQQAPPDVYLHSQLEKRKLAKDPDKK